MNNNTTVDVNVTVRANGFNTEDNYTENNVMDNTIMVSAGRLPGHVREFEVPVGFTVGDVLNLVDPTLPGVVSSGVMFVRKNAVNANLNETLQNGDVVQAAKNVQGNTDIVVSAGRLPGNVREYVVPSGSTVGHILNLVDPTLASAVSSGIMFVRKNAVSAETYDVLQNGDVVQVAKNVQGNMNISSSFNCDNVQINTSVVTQDMSEGVNQMNTENIVVSAGRLPGHVREFVVPVGSNVGDVLSLVDPTLPGVVSSGVMFVRKNAVEADLYETLQSGDVVQAAKNVQGN